MADPQTGDQAQTMANTQGNPPPPPPPVEVKETGDQAVTIADTEPA